MKRQAEMTLDVGSTLKLIKFDCRERLSSIYGIDAEIVASSSGAMMGVMGNSQLQRNRPRKTWIAATYSYL